MSVGAGREGPEPYHREPPAVSEEIHLPGPTILPLTTAIGITLIVVGTTITWILSIVGGLVFLVSAIRWLGDTRRDMAELPDEHL
jgi:hypothetical protein